MSADLSRYRARPPPPSWKPPPLPGEVDPHNLGRGYHSYSSDDENLSKSSGCSNSGSTSANVSRTDETAKQKVTVSAQESTKKSEALPKEPKITKPKEITKPGVIEKQTEKLSPVTPISTPTPTANPTVATQTAPTLTTTTTEPPKKTWGKPSVDTSPPKTEIKKKTESKIPSTDVPKLNGSNAFKNQDSPSPKIQDSTSFTELVSTGLKTEAPTSFPKPVLTGLKDPVQSLVKSEVVSNTEIQMDDKPKGRPLSRFPTTKPAEDHKPQQPKLLQQPDDSTPTSSWNPRKSVKSNAPRNLDSQPETKNGISTRTKTVQPPKTEVQSGPFKKPVPKSPIFGSPEVKKLDPKLNNFGEKSEEKSAVVSEIENDNKTSTIEDLQSAIRLRLKDKSSSDPLSGLTRLDQCLLLASSTCSIRSMRFDELNVKCLVKTFCSTQEDNYPQDDIETINVVLNPDKVWNAEELDQHFDRVADAVNRVGKSNGVVLIQATTDNKGGTRPRKLRLNKAASADGADCDALAGALCVAFFVKHRKLPLESALELIRVRRQDMKPSSALTLQLMEYEKKIRTGSGSRKSKFNWRNIVSSVSQNWIPTTIYFLAVLICAKFVYESVVYMLSKEQESDEEMVCV